MTPLHRRLRAATARAHASLEQEMGLGGPDVTPARYGAALQVLHAVRVGWEPGIAALTGMPRGPHERWLQMDLSALGLAALAPAPPLPLGRAGAAWGARYVLEGSALGGRLLLERAAALGYGPQAGARYFAGHGSETGAVWRQFLHALEGVADPDAVVGGAAEAFGALEAFARPRLRPTSLP